MGTPKIEISYDNFFSVGSELQISQKQLEAFWKTLEKAPQKSQVTPFTKYLYYFGTMIVIAAMSWLMTLSRDIFGAGGLFLVAVAYAVLFAWLGNKLWHKKDLQTPGGLLITIAVCMVPLAIYALQSYFNLWNENQEMPYRDFYTTIHGNWVFMELGTIITALIALRFFPFPFLTAPLFYALWFLTMDIIPYLFGTELSIDQKAWLTIGFGLVLLLISFTLDRIKKDKYAFWGYLFGTLIFWSALGLLMWDKSEWVLIFYLIINIAMMCLAILLQRNVLMIFGALGVFAYLSHLAYTIFDLSIVFPFALSAIGLFIIYLGIIYQRNTKRIEKYLLNKFPIARYFRSKL